MIYYKLSDKYLFSLKDEYSYEKITEQQALDNCQELYLLVKLDKEHSRRSFVLNHVSDLFIKEENLELLKLNNFSADNESIPEKISNLIQNRKIKAVNTEYHNYEQCFCSEKLDKKKVHLLALGDVGSTLLMGLKLLGGNSISSIGIFDRNEDKIKRYEYEMNQTSLPFEFDELPMVHIISRDELFDCDMFVFCASKGVPPVGVEGIDVRMVQFEENAKLLKEYALMAGEKNFKGIFAVVSDPVDLLCKTALIESRGKLVPEQIKGYGLGVMNARAAYYAKKEERFASYLTEGRAFGPHGNDLVIANSIENYDDELSKELTKLTVEANLQVRKTGFKPYIAPALSSGAISIVYTLEGKFHYCSNYVGGVFMGTKNRNTPMGIEIEKIDMNEKLYKRLENTYKTLDDLMKNYK